MKPRSLTGRLLAGVLVSEVVLAAGVGWAGVAFTRRQLAAAFDTALRGRLMGVVALVRYPEQGAGLLFDATRLPPPPDPRHPSFYRVTGRNGAVVADTFPAGIAPVPGRGGYFRFHYRGVEYRGLQLRNTPILDTEENLALPPARLDAAYAAPTAAMRRAIAAAGLAIGLASLGLLGLALWLAAWTIRRGLAPLRLLAEEAGAISPRNWSFRPAPELAATRELQPVVQALERMLARLHDAHQQQRAFLADAAHHLKTPVAILKSTWQGILQRPRSEAEYAAAGAATVQDVERLERLLQRMLRLARAEQDPRPAPAVELGATCAAALERAAPVARRRGVELRGGGWTPAMRVAAEADDLELVWLNLLENAIEASPPGGAVELRCTAGGGTVEVAVRDQGPGVAAEERTHIFERFRRGANSSPGGFGLGLAIAHAIVAAQGGRLELDGASSREWPGACFRARLRLAPPGPGAGAQGEELKPGFIGMG